MNWLFKEEPTHYGFDAFVKDKKTVWSGVKNPLAQKHLRAVRKGDRDFLLPHRRRKSGGRDREGARRRLRRSGGHDGKQSVVDVAPVKKLPRPVTLKEIKADRAFKDFPLVRISRLSVMPVTDAEWKRIESWLSLKPQA